MRLTEWVPVGPCAGAAIAEIGFLMDVETMVARGQPFDFVLDCDGLSILLLELHHARHAALRFGSIARLPCFANWAFGFDWERHPSGINFDVRTTVRSRHCPSQWLIHHQRLQHVHGSTAAMKGCRRKGTKGCCHQCIQPGPHPWLPLFHGVDGCPGLSSVQLCIRCLHRSIQHLGARRLHRILGLSHIQWACGNLGRKSRLGCNTSIKIHAGCAAASRSQEVNDQPHSSPCCCSPTFEHGVVTLRAIHWISKK
mmetsp:Transcript_81684/g.136572  ORF Transcript_81684/g.136572 Transcript_81684/m.136572 type:complete len:254 (-) Transcript_81684:13-774(-)